MYVHTYICTYTRILTLYIRTYIRSCHPLPIIDLLYILFTDDNCKGASLLTSVLIHTIGLKLLGCEQEEKGGRMMW